MAPGAAPDDIDPFVIVRDSIPPTGTPVSYVHIDREQPALELDVDRPMELAFLNEASDPLSDWSDASISNVRTWIGTTEVTNSLDGTNIRVGGYPELTYANFIFSGEVVGGSGNLTREFLQSGTSSFVVNGGSPTVVSFALSADEAAAIYPNMDPPKFIGRSATTMTQYQQGSWAPVVSWGSGWNGYITVNGAVPAGLWWDQWSQTLSGVPEEQGTFGLTLTAHGQHGVAAKSYTLVIGPLQDGPANVVGQIWAEERQHEGDPDAVAMSIDASGFFRPDNPRFASALPVSTQFAQTGFLHTVIDEYTLVDTEGGVVPASGQLELIMFGGSPDALSLYGTLIPDGSSSDLVSLLHAGGKITFRVDGGGLNTIHF